MESGPVTVGRSASDLHSAWDDSSPPRSKMNIIVLQLHRPASWKPEQQAQPQQTAPTRGMSPRCGQLGTWPFGRGRSACPKSGGIRAAQSSCLEVSLGGKRLAILPGVHVDGVVPGQGFPHPAKVLGLALIQVRVAEAPVPQHEDPTVETPEDQHKISAAFFISIVAFVLSSCRPRARSPEPGKNPVA